MSPIRPIVGDLADPQLAREGRRRVITRRFLDVADILLNLVGLIRLCRRLVVRLDGGDDMSDTAR